MKQIILKLRVWICGILHKPSVNKQEKSLDYLTQMIAADPVDLARMEKAYQESFVTTTSTEEFDRIVDAQTMDHPIDPTQDRPLLHQAIRTNPYFRYQPILTASLQDLDAEYQKMENANQIARTESMRRRYQTIPSALTASEWATMMMRANQRPTTPRPAPPSGMGTSGPSDFTGVSSTFLGMDHLPNQETEDRNMDHYNLIQYSMNRAVQTVRTSHGEGIFQIPGLTEIYATLQRKDQRSPQMCSMYLTQEELDQLLKNEKEEKIEKGKEVLKKFRKKSSLMNVLELD